MCICVYIYMSICIVRYVWHSPSFSSSILTERDVRCCLTEKSRRKQALPSKFILAHGDPLQFHAGGVMKNVTLILRV